MVHGSPLRTLGEAHGRARLLLGGSGVCGAHDRDSPGRYRYFCFSVRAKRVAELQILGGNPFKHVICELELELIQSHMTQKPVLRGEVDAHALRV